VEGRAVGELAVAGAKLVGLLVVCTCVGMVVAMLIREGLAVMRLGMEGAKLVGLLKKGI
jgi:hypothetical protein